MLRRNRHTGAVRLELANLPLIPEIRILPVSPFGAHFVEGALGRLHRGELEAMVLAREIQADHVLLDDVWRGNGRNAWGCR